MTETDDENDDVHVYMQLMSKTSNTAKSETKSSPFDRLECVAHKCPLLLRVGQLLVSKNPLCNIQFTEFCYHVTASSKVCLQLKLSYIDLESQQTRQMFIATSKITDLSSTSETQQLSVLSQFP